MKKYVTIVLLLSALNAAAQTTLPKGFEPGSIVLPDKTLLTGSVKNIMQSAAAVVFIGTDGKKKTYTASDINAVMLGSTQFVSYGGDFFKVIKSGKILLLEKASQVAGKTVYNGSDAYVLPGTEGNIGDNFLQKPRQTPVWLNKRNWISILTAAADNCSAATQIQQWSDDFAKLPEAVDLLNMQCK